MIAPIEILRAVDFSRRCWFRDWCCLFERIPIDTWWSDATPFRTTPLLLLKPKPPPDCLYWAIGALYTKRSLVLHRSVGSYWELWGFVRGRIYREFLGQWRVCLTGRNSVECRCGRWEGDRSDLFIRYCFFDLEIRTVCFSRKQNQKTQNSCFLFAEKRWIPHFLIENPNACLDFFSKTKRSNFLVLYCSALHNLFSITLFICTFIYS